MTRIVFMGTPEFAVTTLEKLYQCGYYEMVAVVTQPDRPRGRGKQVSFSPVKEKALELGLPVLQPLRIKEADFIEQLRGYQPDLIIVVAFGQILPESILAIPPLGCLNVHASLLPAYRGAAPIQRVLLNGGEKTGVSVMLMDKGLDTGDVLAQEEVAIFREMNFGQLHDALALVGADLLVRTIPRWLSGEITPCPQHCLTGGEPSYAVPLAREDEIINWANSAKMIYNQIRGLTPRPGACTFFRGKQLKIRECALFQSDASATENKAETGAPGTVLSIVKGQGFVVQTGEGCLLVTQVQPVGKKNIAAQSFLNGYHLEVGYVFHNVGE